MVDLALIRRELAKIPMMSKDEAARAAAALVKEMERKFPKAVRRG